MRMKGETSSNLLPTTPPALVPTCQILYIGFLMWAIIHESPRAEMWTPYLEGLNQNSLKWELSLLPTNYPLFVVNQLAKSSEVKKKMHILLSVTYWGWMLLTMAESMKQLCIRDEWFLTLNLLLSKTAKLVHRASELRYHISHISAFPSTCTPLFIKVLSAPGVHLQLGSNFAGPSSFSGVGIL